MVCKKCPPCGAGSRFGNDELSPARLPGRNRRLRTPGLDIRRVGRWNRREMAHRCSRGSPNLKQDSNGVASVGQLWRPAAVETETSRRPWADLSLLKVGGSRGADEQRRWTAQRRGERRGRARLGRGGEEEDLGETRRGKRRLDYTHATRELLQAAARRRTTEETPDEGGRARCKRNRRGFVSRARERARCDGRCKDGAQEREREWSASGENV